MAVTLVTLLAICVLLAWAFYRLIIVPLFLSPLARIPAAHPTASLSPLWILWKRHQFTENSAIYAAHEKLGAYVRLGPKEISVDCYEGGLRTIYAGGYEKDEWYHNLFDNYGNVPNMFSTLGSRQHASRKRMISHVLSKSYLQSSPSMHAISEIIIRQRLLPKLKANGQDEIDVHRLFNSVAMDFVTAYQFGLCNSTNFIQDDKTAEWWLSLYQSRKKFTFWPQEMPTLTKFASKFGLNLSPPFVALANKDIEDWCLRMVDAAAASLASRSSDDADLPENEAIVYKQLSAALKREAAKPSGSVSSLVDASVSDRLQIASEFLDNLAAGHETSAITLTYLFHELSARPLLQKQLRDELIEHKSLIIELHGSEDHALPSAKTIDALPVLHTVLMETLRLHAAIPGPQPRTTPSNARLGPYGGLPAGVRVSASAYCLHRLPEVFAEPQSWLPNRWLPGTSASSDDDSPAPESHKERLAQMHKHFWAFGSGGRMCIGSNLAMQEMKLIICAILSNYRVECVDDEGIEQEDAYTAQPTGQKLIMRLTPWQTSVATV